jgi:hypothetical protein
MPEPQTEDPGASTRVEIELTQNDESRARWRKPGAGATVEVSSKDDPSEASVAVPELEPQLTGEVNRPQSLDRRRLVVAGAIIAVVALFVGWALGRSGGSPAGEAQPSPSTTEASGLETLAPAIVPSTVPATTRPVVRAGPTTTTLPEWHRATIADIDPAAAALDIRIVVVGGGRIVELDTGSGEMDALSTGKRYSQPPLVNAGDDWIVIRDLDSGVSQLVRTGALPVSIEVSDPWSMHFQRDTGLFWRVPSSFAPGEPMSVHEIDHEGHDTGRTFEIPAGVWPMAGDPSDGVVVGAPGGTYHVGPDGTRRLTTGNLIALSATIAVVTDCGEEDFADCGLYVLDRVTGQRTKLDVNMARTGVPIGVFDIQSPAFWGTADLLGAVSPDDRWAPIMVTGNVQQFGLVDLTTGEFVPVAGNPPSGLWWAPDSRSAIYNLNSRLTLFDTEQRTWTDILPASVSVDAFAVRP